jgi:hypothetical protein
VGKNRQTKERTPSRSPLPILEHSRSGPAPGRDVQQTPAENGPRTIAEPSATRSDVVREWIDFLAAILAEDFLRHMNADGDDDEPGC